MFDSLTTTDKLVVVSNYGLLFATLVLAWATVKLAWHTKQLTRHNQKLADLTNDLVRIEDARENRLRKEKRLSDIKRALTLSEKVRKIDPGEFISTLEHGRVNEDQVNEFKELMLLSSYVEEHDLDFKKNVLDLLSAIEGGAIGGNGPRLRGLLRTIQDRLYAWPIHRWREELRGGQISN